MATEHGKRAARPFIVTGSFDIECAGWDKFVVGATYSPTLGSGSYGSICDLTSALLSHGGTWWAWNGGKYDSLAILEELRRRGLRAAVTLAGSRVIRVTCGDLTLCDACALVPMSLDEAAPLAGLAPPGILGWPCDCGRACGGYCQITTRLDLFRRAELATYCERDAKVCYAIVKSVQAECEAHGYALRSTLGATAWATAASWLGLPASNLTRGAWAAIRSAYAGGRVSVLRPASREGHHYDISAAYPAALAHTPLPIGDPTEMGGKRALAQLTRGMPGVYECTVTQPDTFLPVLPVRSTEGDRIGYPTGELHGTWTLPELEYAVSLGAKVTRVHNGYVWGNGTAVLFDDLVAYWFAQRAHHGKGTAWGAWYRLLANSLTGKLAEGPDRAAVLLNPERLEICQPGRPASDKAGCVGNRCTGRCGSYTQVDRWGMIWSAPYYRLGASAHVHWAAYLTAATRIDWHRGASSVDPLELVYGDTDSLWLAGGKPPAGAGDGLGQWAFKHSFADFQCRSPKAYRYIDGSSGECVARAAGLSGVTDRHFSDDQLADLAIAARGVLSFREAARSPGTTGLFRRRVFKRGLSEPGADWFGDRKVGRDGRTYAVDQAVLKAHWDQRNRSKHGQEKEVTTRA